MVSRRHLLIGAASISAAGLAGCSQSNVGGPSSDNTDPRATNWLPASQSLPVQLQGDKLSNIVTVDEYDGSSEDTVLGLPLSDIDLYATIETGDPTRYVAIEGDFDVSDIRDEATSTIAGSFEEKESYNGYTRLSSSSAAIGIASGRLAVVQPPDAGALEDMIDTREGESQSLSAVNDRVGRLSDTIGDGDIVQLSARPQTVTSDNESESDLSDIVGRAYSFDVQPDQSPFVQCYLYRNAELATPDELRNQIDANYNATAAAPEYDVTTDGALVTASGEVPTAALVSGN